MDRITIKDGQFYDSRGRVIQLRGVNFDPSVKTPYGIRSADRIDFETVDDVSFVGHPVPLPEVEDHINRLKSLGFNMIRFPITWESLEHKGPREYDYQYMDYLINVLSKIEEIGGIYVYLDPHQDVWSRASGGSGAPIWTLYSAGFNPSRFYETHAAILHSDYVNQHSKEEFVENPYPKMLWTTNYYKLACQTMFTLFFAGNIFAPKCEINGQNLQSYLQDHFIDAFIELYERIIEKAPHLIQNNCVIGIETINEPNEGLIGTPDIGEVPESRLLRLGGTPSAFQSFILGEGYETEVDMYKITSFGPKKYGKRVLNQKHEDCWLTGEERDRIDKLYGWHRNDEWKAHTCIWRLHEVWEIDHESGNPKILKPKYFCEQDDIPKTIDDRYFIEVFFRDYYINFFKKIRKLSQELIVILQAPVFRMPPSIKGTNLVDDRVACAGHFYDGYTIMFKKWSGLFTIDTYGMVCKKYSNPVSSLALGTNNVKNCIKQQLYEMQIDAQKNLGLIPMIFTEIGAPYDLDDKKAYSTGDYTSQISAIDAIGHALEGNNLSFSMWCYNHENNTKWGDNWNNEDFSVWSNEKHKKDNIEVKMLSGNMPNSVKLMKETEAIRFGLPVDKLDLCGFRALDSLLRPFPISIDGEFLTAEFNHKKKTYHLEIKTKNINNETKIYVPRYHFELECCVISTTSGEIHYDPDHQIIAWKSASVGKNTLRISKRNKSACVIC